MVRAGVVGHPSEWDWCGDDELTGRRSRYRLLALDRMIDSLEMDSMADFQHVYSDCINEHLQGGHLAREAAWTESLAIGDRRFVESVAGKIRNRFRFAYSDAGNCAPNAVCVREAYGSYSSE